MWPTWFFDPLDALETLLIDPSAFLASRFNAALDPSALPGSPFFLTSVARLIIFKSTAPQGLSLLNVDSVSGQIALVVPEPGGLTLFALGLLGVGGFAWHRRRCQSSQNHEGVLRLRGKQRR
ncbi:hypothetical protein BH23PLA1_BH23PLA1_34300 [soil metagenome]